MENSYSDNKIYTSEIGTALEDYVYGGEVLMSIKSLTPLSSSNIQTTVVKRINMSNIINKDKSSLKLDDTCAISNGIKVNIPLELCRYKIPSHYSNDNWSWDGPDYSGKKGDQFLINFIGGDINQPIAIRKV